ncbi:MAG: metal ABC transporter substrate-binding protein [Acidimicrobiia bacterium]
MKTQRKPIRFTAALALLAVMASACTTGQGGSTDGAGVLASFYPLEEAARAVAGDLRQVAGITPPGQGPHDLQLEPRQVEAIENADIVFYLGRGFQPQVEDALANTGEGVNSVDLLEAVELLAVDPQLEGTTGEVDGEVLDGDVDPHVWLDPNRMISMVEEMVRVFSEDDPDNAEAYRANADAYLVDLSGLDARYREGLDNCESRVIVTSHRAFGYMAESYDLIQIPIAGIAPGDEPDARTLEAIAARAEAEGVRTIFLEEIAPPELAETVAAEIGAELSLLDPIEGPAGEELEAGTNYATIMDENLERLIDGLGCAR